MVDCGAGERCGSQVVKVERRARSRLDVLVGGLPSRMYQSVRLPSHLTLTAVENTKTLKTPQRSDFVHSRPITGCDK